MKISLNGTMYDEKEAVISVYDHGFLYGMGLFETFRTYRGKPFLLAEHMHRLSEGCHELGIAFQPDERRAAALAAQLLEANGLEEAYLRYTISAGVDVLGLPAGSYTQPTEIVYVKPLPPRDEAVYSRGKALQLLKLPRNTPEGLYRLKSFHYMNSILAKRELQSYPWAAGAEGLMLTEDGYAAEGIVSNLFFVSAGACRTPSLDTGILPGITRGFTLRLAEQLGIRTEEGLYAWEDIRAAEEVFYVNSIQEIVPVVTLYTPDGQSFCVGDGRPGPVTQRLMEAYRRQSTGCDGE